MSQIVKTRDGEADERGGGLPGPEPKHTEEKPNEEEKQ